MEFVKVAFFLLAGVMVLTYGANLFVASSSHFARRMGISPLIIGLTIVSIGTSAPEFAVNVLAAVQGNADIAMGNVVGSNIFNIAVIIGICAIILPLGVSQQLIRLDIPLMVFASLLCWWFGRDGSIALWESIVFMLGMIGYLVLQIVIAKRQRSKSENEFNKEFDDKGNPLKDGVLFFVGLGMLVGGAKLFVEGAISMAHFFGLSEAVIALTIVAAGTSLPEVATSVAATMKGEREIAVGNVIGSNIFNILGVLGFSGLFVPNGLNVNAQMVQMDIPLMLIFSAVCAPLAFWRQKFERPVGILFVVSYVAYVGYLISLN